MNDLTITNTNTTPVSVSVDAPAQPESVDSDTTDRDTADRDTADRDTADRDTADRDSADTSGTVGDIDIALLEQTLEYIRPAIQMDGGDIILLGTEDGVVNLQMVGACGGCPMSMMTLKAGIERILTDRVPGVVEVNATA